MLNSIKKPLILESKKVNVHVWRGLYFIRELVVDDHYCKKGSSTLFYWKKINITYFKH